MPSLFRKLLGKLGGEEKGNKADGHVSIPPSQSSRVALQAGESRVDEPVSMLRLQTSSRPALQAGDSRADGPVFMSPSQPSSRPALQAGKSPETSNNGPNRVHPAYQQLNVSQREIRLLTIRAVPEDDAASNPPMECDLVIVPLEKAPTYQALSYVWGDPTIKSPITLNSAELQVTKNLATALKRLRIRIRSEVEKTYFWIDAICINQENVAEKNHQVPLMGSIYRRADEVVIWLGEEDDDTHLAFGLVERWGREMQAFDLPLTDFYQDNLDQLTDKLPKIVEKIQDPFNEPAWKALISMYMRPYWTRIWILQELVLARKAVLVCGSHELDYHLVKMASNTFPFINLLSIFSHLSVDMHALIATSNLPFQHDITNFSRGLNEAGRLDMSLFNLVRFTKQRDATNPRDKFYGVLGMWEPQANAAVVPDYGLSIADVYLQFMKSYLKSHKSLTTMSLAGVGRAKEDVPLNLPSWTPNLGNNNDHSGSMLRSSYTAAGDTEAVVKFSLSKKVLTTRGVICDAITEISEFGEPNPMKPRLHRWHALAQEQGPISNGTGAPWRQAFFRTLTADFSGFGPRRRGFQDRTVEMGFYNEAAGFMTLMAQIFGDQEAQENKWYSNDESVCDYAKAFALWTDSLPAEARPADDGYSDAYHSLAPSIFATFGAPDLGGDYYHPKSQRGILEGFCGKPHSSSYIRWPRDEETSRGSMNTLQIIKVASEATKERSFFLSREGYMGLAPLYAKPGDLVCILQGCGVPLIIRKEEKSEYYQVVGDSYIYGMMNSEIMNDAAIGEREIQELQFV